MASEITEEEDHFIQDKESQKMKIRRIIDHQKALYLSSSSSSSSSSFTAASSRSSSLLGLMRGGSTSLRRLFDMEHTSLADYFNDYSATPIIKPILLWGSETDNDEIRDDPWAEIARSGGGFGSGGGDEERVFSSFDEGFRRKRRLVRKKSYKRLPRFSLWRCGRFRFRFRLKLIRKIGVLIRGRVFW